MRTAWIATLFGAGLGAAAGCAGDGEGGDARSVTFDLVTDLTGSLAHPQWLDAAALGHAGERRGFRGAHAGPPSRRPSEGQQISGLPRR